MTAKEFVDAALDAAAAKAEAEAEAVAAHFQATDEALALNGAADVDRQAATDAALKMNSAADLQTRTALEANTAADVELAERVTNVETVAVSPRAHVAPGGEGTLTRLIHR